VTDNILILLSVVFLLIAGLCVPFLIQILRTAREMALTLRLFNQRLPLIMKNLEEILDKTLLSRGRSIGVFG
jgi:hypothetical protein